MKLKNYLLIVLTLFCGLISHAQGTYDVSGTVKGASDGFPIPGVNVIISGTTSGVATDFDGNYKIKVKSGDTLEFSSIGYATQKIAVTGQKTINITLQEDSEALEEVVVIGYGARKKTDITGAVSSVKSEELNAFPVLNAAQALQGRASGVEVQSNNGGEPGAPIAIKIRGNTSINASSTPLIVVDGFVGATMPQAGDIQSIEVLKDASSTAIYGAQGSNGVIIVTTKKGRAGKLRFEINSSYSVQSTTNRLDLLDAEDFVTYQNLVRENQAITAAVASGDPADEAFTPYVGGGFDTDWQDLVYRVGSTSNHQFSFSGGTEKADFYASATYFNQEGVLVNSAFERLSFLTNINAQLTNKLKVGLNLAGTISEKNGVTTAAAGGSTGSSGTDAIVANTFRFAPDLGIFDANDPNLFSTNSVGDPIDNPYGVATARQDDTQTDDFRANIYFDYEILEGLNFRTTVGVRNNTSFRGIFTPSTLDFSSGGAAGRAIIDNDRTQSLLTESYLTYKKEIGKGLLTLLGGISYQKTENKGSYVEGFDTGSDTFSYYGVANAGSFVAPGTNVYFNEPEIQSQFGRLNYDYDDRYLITATVRRDGASVFAENEKHAIFPSAALGWKVSSEEFMANSETVSNLKLRASWGQTGNPSISNFGSLDTFQQIYASLDGETAVAYTPLQPANPDLKWETSTQFNIGLDLGLFNNAVSLSAEYYNIDTEDLIMTNQGIPDIAGFQSSNILANVGAINNKGFEVSLNTRNISTDDFQWTTDFVFSTNKSEVITLIGGIDFLSNGGTPNYYDSTNSSILREGEEVAQFWGYDYAGVYTGGNVPEGTVTVANAVAGDPLFYDQEDEDGLTNGELGAEDRTIIGNPNPDFTYGITNNFIYKNWDLNIFFQGSQGGEIFNITQSQLNNGDANTTYDYFNSAYSATNLNSNQPRVGNNSGRELSSRFVEDGSYLRLKNVAIGYNLPSTLMEKIKVDQIRLSLSAQNLLTFTNYSGLDPEVNFAGGSSNGLSSNTVIGFDFGNYPTIQSVTFGVNIKF